MSSHSNRRIRAQRKRHYNLVARLKDRIRTFEGQERHKEAGQVWAQLMLLLVPHAVKIRGYIKTVRTKDGKTKDVQVVPSIQNRINELSKEHGWDSRHVTSIVAPNGT